MSHPRAAKCTTHYTTCTHTYIYIYFKIHNTSTYLYLFTPYTLVAGHSIESAPYERDVRLRMGVRACMVITEQYRVGGKQLKIAYATVPLPIDRFRPRETTHVRLRTFMTIYPCTNEKHECILRRSKLIS